MRMKHLLSLALALTLACALTVDAALAKRAGGGGSFGSRSTYSRPYTPSTPSYAPTSPAKPTQPAQQAQPAPQPTPTQTPGMGSRLGWGLGGLLAGGLLGSMLFGGGWGSGGGIGLLDMLLIGLVVFLGFKLLRGRSRPAASGGWQAPPDENRDGVPPADQRSRTEQSWDQLRTSPPGGGAAGSTGGFGVTPQAGTESGPAVPPGFNVPEFLEGAKTVYARLQHSWDRRDLEDIALFTTPEVLAEMRRQAAADPAPSKTEILLVNAKLLEFREEALDTVATVLFDVLLREDPTEERPKQVREVWHFSRPTADGAANWRLEGIQQLED